VSGKLQGPEALHPEKGRQYPLNRRLGVPQNRSPSFEEEKNLAHVAIRTPDRPQRYEMKWVWPVLRHYHGILITKHEICSQYRRPPRQETNSNPLEHERV
jgi:hypothetical protein